MNKSDIILVPFPFTDLTGNKLRPKVRSNIYASLWEGVLVRIEISKC